MDDPGKIFEGQMVETEEVLRLRKQVESLRASIQHGQSLLREAIAQRDRLQFLLENSRSREKLLRIGFGYVRESKAFILLSRAAKTVTRNAL